MCLEQRLGCAGRLGCGIERPTEMLARMTRAKRAPIVRKHLVVELSDDRALRRERRFAFAPPQGQAAAPFSPQPRGAPAGPPSPPAGPAPGPLPHHHTPPRT